MSSKAAEEGGKGLFSSRRDPATGTAPAVSEGRIDTIVGKEAEFKGTLLSSGLIRIEGRFEGEIAHKGDIAIGESGLVHANIQARNLTVAGTITGNIDVSGKLELLPTAKVTGDIAVASLVIAEGALFKGTSTMRAAGEQAGVGEGRPVASA